MARRKLTVDRYAEIKRRLAEGRGVREISRALGCSRRLVREIQRGSKESPEAPKQQSDPLWMLQIDWPAIIQDLGLGHPLKFFCGKSVPSIHDYVPELLEASSTVSSRNTAARASRRASLRPANAWRSITPAIRSGGST